MGRFGQTGKRRGVADARQRAVESPRLPRWKGSRATFSVHPLAQDGRTPGPTRVEGGRIIEEHQMDWSRFDNCRRLPVVGYDFHQPALLTAGGRQLRRDTDRYEGTARLVLEPDNPHDRSAVKVMLNGQKIGYLKASTAKRLNKRLIALAATGAAEGYICLIRFMAPGKLQAHLQVPYSSKLLEGHKNPKRKGKG